MLLEIFLAIALGILAGTFSGLIPGVHVNMITVLILGLAVSFPNISVLLFAIFIIALALTHSFLDSIPSIFLGAPDESMVVALLPGHQLLISGFGHKAVVYTLVGSLSALIFTVLFFPYAFNFLVFLADFISPHLSYILIFVVLVLLVLSKRFFLNLFFFLIAGVLGLITFQLVNQNQILLPLLSGLFGVSTLLLSLLSITVLPKQFLLKRTIDVTFNDIFSNTSRASILGMFASFLPGIGSSQAAIIASSTMKSKTPKDYLLLVGGINTTNFVFSLLTVFLLSKARNGAILGVNQLIADLTLNHFFLFVCVVLIAAGVAVPLGLFLSRWFARFVSKVSYSLLVYSVIFLILFLVIIFSGFQGVLILLTATSLGLLANFFGASKNMLLGCLLLPVIIYLL